MTSAEMQQDSNTATALGNEQILKISHLYKSFGSNQVLIDFNLELKKGESVVVLGKCIPPAKHIQIDSK